MRGIARADTVVVDFTRTLVFENLVTNADAPMAVSRLFVSQDHERSESPMNDVRVYRYGLLAPTTGRLLVLEQMRKANAYRNDLVQIERGRRAAVRALLTRHGDVAALDVAAEALAEVLRAALHDARAERVRLESRTNTPAVREAVASARRRASEARARVTAARRAARADEVTRAAADQVEALAGDLRRAARALVSQAGLYWGTYQLVEEAAQQSASTTALFYGLEPKDPPFRRFSGEGQVSVQVMNGMSAADATGCEDRRVRLRLVTQRRSGDCYELSLRVGSDEKKMPLWAVFPLKMHRALPPGATIKRVTVDLTYRGPKAEWSALFVVGSDAARIPCGKTGAPERCGTGAVAIDLGWRRLPDGDLRVAVAFDGTRDQELRLPAYTMESFDKIEGLQGVRDRLLHGMLAVVQGVREHAPVWFRDRTVHVHAWRSERRLAGLVTRWRADRFPGDEEAFAQADAWSRSDRHLWWYESGAAINVHRRRRDLYRRWAADLARKYAVLVLEKFDLRSVTRVPPVGRDTHQAELARRQRRIAATSELRSALENAFRARGGEVVVVSAVETTMRCNVCGLVEVFDAAAKVRHTCANGHEWDQDENAGRNLLERWSSGSTPEPARKPQQPNGDGEIAESRWTRARRLSAEKTARIAASRESTGKTG